MTTDRRHTLSLVVPAVALMVLVPGCGNNGLRNTVHVSSPPATVRDRDFDRESFDHSTVVNNPWFSLTPGTQFIYSGHVTEGGRRVGHRVIFTVTDLVKVIDGVRSVVIWDRDYTGARLTEGELAFFAQDDGGNVWLLGEYPEEYEDGRFAGAPDTWIAGLAGSRPGVAMRARPASRTPSYLQGWAPEIQFADRATVRQTGGTNCVPLGCFTDVLLIDEWNPDEQGAHQLKYYAPGVGNIRVGFEGSDQQKEGLVLMSVIHLNPRAVARARVLVMDLERRAYRVSEGLYGRTPPSAPG